MTSKLVNEPLVREVLGHPDLQELPGLAGLQYEVVVSRPCSGCGKRRSRTDKVPPVEAVKQVLYRMSDPDLQKVKNALNCTRLVFYFRQRGMPPRAIR